MSASGNAFQLEIINYLPSIRPKVILASLSRKLTTCSAVTPTNLLSAATTVNPSHSRQRHVGAPLVTMEHVPPEILHLIFGLACNDDGLTARSLSLVSKTIREKSRYTGFHSVTCHDVAQTLALARILSETPPHLRVFGISSCSTRTKTTHPHPPQYAEVSQASRYVRRQPARPYGHTTFCGPRYLHDRCTNFVHIVVVY
jgi:hypothetical protein